MKEEGKLFQANKSLREFFIAIPTLQDRLTVVLQTEMKGHVLVT